MIWRSCQSDYPATESIVLNRVETFKEQEGARRDNSPDTSFRKFKGGGALIIKKSDGNVHESYSFSMFDPEMANITRVIREFGETVYSVDPKLLDIIENKVLSLMGDSGCWHIVSDYVRYGEPEELDPILDGEIKISLSEKDVIRELYFRKPEKDIWQGEFRLVVRIDSRVFKEDKITLDNSDCDLKEIFKPIDIIRRFK